MPRVTTVAQAEVSILSRLKRGIDIWRSFGVRNTPLGSAYREARMRLLVAGDIARVGPQKYRITDKGRARLAETTEGK